MQYKYVRSRSTPVLQIPVTGIKSSNSKHSIFMKEPPPPRSVVSSDPGRTVEYRNCVVPSFYTSAVSNGSHFAPSQHPAELLTFLLQTHMCCKALYVLYDIPCAADDACDNRNCCWRDTCFYSELHHTTGAHAR